MKKILEIFAGTRSFGKVCDMFGCQILSIENEPKFMCNCTMNFLDFDPKKYEFVPDVIWASPPCTSYSIAGIRFHRTGQIPKSKEAILGDRLIKHLLQVIEYYLDKNPKLIFFIENPRGMLRKMDFMKHLGTPKTVTYCQYGDKRMKPTDIWTNSKTWKPRGMCKNGDSCHEAAPRGSKTGGTQGLRKTEDRSRIPFELMTEILGSTYM